MRTDLADFDRYFRYGLLAVAGLLGVVDFLLESGNPWVRGAFVVSVAGLVGYFTNFLAIKMLFQPKRGQVLGWRGLVPKNKEQIAKSLGESVQEQLLSPDIILAYIRERRLIEAGTQSLAAWLDQTLQRPEVRRRITEWLVQLANERGPDLVNDIFDAAEETAKAIARNPGAIEANWQQLRVALLDFLQQTDKRVLAAETLQRLFLNYLPSIAAWLNRALEGYLQDRRAVGSVGLGLKNLFSFDQAAIEQLLRRFSEDPEISDQVMTTLDAIMDGIQQELESEQIQARIQTHLESWIETAAGLSRQHLLPGVIQQFGDYLNDAGNWQQIEEQIIAVLQWLKERTLTLVNSDTGQTTLRAGLERAVQKLNVTELVEEQVMKLDTDELEKMVLDNTGGNLTVIQVLGGGLGIVAGTVQVHLAFAVPIAGALGVVWLAWWINERRCAA